MKEYKYKCEKCGLSKWNGIQIPLQLHHINGNRYDNRIENLQLLCPNCHAQTDNFAGKNILRKKKIYNCKNCGKEFYASEGSSKNSNIYCSVECKDEQIHNRNKFIQNKKILKPDKETLCNDFKLFGNFSQIAKKYNVSDTAVRKWFKKYNLSKETLNF